MGRDLSRPVTADGMERADAQVKVVVAEDSPTQALRLRHVLEKRGYEVRVCPDGLAALEAVREAPPTLVISDVVMPRMDGYELSRRIKDDPALAAIPVMLLTALSDPHDVIRGIEAGADHFVVKPFEEEYLVSQVRFLLENRRGREEGRQGDAITVQFDGERHEIRASRGQILNLLLSTYGAAVERNKELARAQAELQSVNAQLQLAFRELESFSHSVSHDLRAPVQKIQGFGELLREACGDRLDETARHYLERVMASARHMNELIEALLALARVSQVELAALDVDLGAIARRALAELAERDPARRVETHVDDGLRARGDPRLYEAAIRNLLENAWKFTAKREAAAIEVRREPGAQGKLAFAIRDNGAGFDPRYAGKLFEPFRRLHSERDFPGTGIGLATVRRVIERHGGAIRAEGAPGAGAVFHITLPAP
jgi:signal transduction histidine kinase